MQLNNITTGEIININKSKDSGIFYEIFENKYCLEHNLFPINKVCEKRDSDLLPTIPLTENQLIELSSQLEILKTETNFELSNDLQNWCIKKGSEGGDTLIRLLIPNTLIIKELNTGSNLDLLIKAIESLSPFAIRGVNYSTQYLEYLLPEHRIIVESYPEIIIENKV